MSLNAYAAEKRLKLFEELRNGLDPSEGEFDSALLAEGRIKGQPQLGTTRYEPDSIIIEFIFPDSQSSATVFTVKLKSPQRIVFMPVPSWVVESIWQGEIDGSFQFESDARKLLEAFQAGLQREPNAKWFERRQASRRE
jgi:hypothetical protein